MTIAECINVLLIIEDYFKEDFTKEEKKALGMAIEILVTLDRERITILDPRPSSENFQNLNDTTTPPLQHTTKKHKNHLWIKKTNYFFKKRLKKK